MLENVCLIYAAVRIVTIVLMVYGLTQGTDECVARVQPLPSCDRQTEDTALALRGHCIFDRSGSLTSQHGDSTGSYTRDLDFCWRVLIILVVMGGLFLRKMKRV